MVIDGSQQAIFDELTRTDRDFILENLKAIVETGRPPFSTRLMYAMFGAMEFVLPKKSKTANWPLEKP